MKPNGQHKTNGRSKNGATLTDQQPEIALRRDSAAYAAGFRECYGLLTVILSELSIEARQKYIDRLRVLDERLRLAEKYAGKGL